MTADHSIDEWLVSRGFGVPETKRQARVALEEAGLTRPGKQRISAEKTAKVEALLRERFFLHCERPECQGVAAGSGRTPVLCDPRGACERCGGSVNAGAATSLIEACRRAGVRRMVVVGGSPAVREELIAAVGDALDLRTVDGTERRTSDRARADLDWADIVMIWGGSELNHKVSMLYTQAPGALRKKVVLVARRGVAALLDAASEHLASRRR